MQKKRSRSREHDQSLLKMRFITSALEVFAVLLFFASYCHGAPIPHGCFGRWRKISWKLPARPTTTRLQCRKGDKKKYSEDGSGEVNGLLPQPRSFFTWEASIHGPTGVASSNEWSGPFSLTTEKASPWPLSRTKASDASGDSGSISLDQDEEGRSQRLMEEEEHLIVETSRRFVDTWADFLCQGKISLGILRCVKTDTKKKGKRRKARWERGRKIRKLAKQGRKIRKLAAGTTASSSSLLARFAPLPVKLLEFGQMVESSSPFSIYDYRQKRSSLESVTVLGSWDIPLESGTLILEDDKPRRRKSGSFFCRSVPEDRGKLMFTIVKTEPLPNVDQDGNSIESCRHSNSYEIITGIRNYRPWLAGGGYTSTSEENQTHDNIWDALKANRETTTRRLCHAFYLSTQSMVHAYVTWRFHHAWRKQLATAVRECSTTATEGESSQNNHK